MITYSAVKTAQAEANALGFVAKVDGKNSYLVVAVMYLAPNEESVTSVSWQGQQFKRISANETESLLKMELWTLVSPFQGETTIDVEFSDIVKSICVGINFIGVDQKTPYYFLKDGSGKESDGTEIAVSLTEGTLVFSLGAFLNAVGAVSEVSDVELWNFHYAIAFRSKGAVRASDSAQDISIPLRLVDNTDWCFQVLGLNPQT